MFNKIEINNLESYKPLFLNVLMLTATILLSILISLTFFYSSHIIGTITCLALPAYGFFFFQYTELATKASVFNKIENMTFGELKDFYNSLECKKSIFRIGYLKKREIENILVNLANWAGIEPPESFPLNFKPVSSTTLEFNDFDDSDAMNSINNLKYFYMLDHILLTSKFNSIPIKDFNKLVINK